MIQCLDRRRWILACAAAAGIAASAAGQGQQATREAPARASSGRVLAVLDPSGVQVGVRRWREGRTEIRMRGGVAFTAPRYQRWVASSDGRTVVAAGDPTVPEHPFELSVEIYRDGVRVARPDFALDPESSITVSADGRVAIAGHAPNRREQWFVIVFDTQGNLAYRHQLAPQEQAKDLVLASDAVLVRTHGLRQEGVDGAVRRVDAVGVSELLSAPGLLGLVDLDGRGHALLHFRDSIALMDAGTGELRWRSESSLRPLGPHGYAWLESEDGAAVAMLHGSLQRRGQPVPPVQLALFDVQDGTMIKSTTVVRRGALADARLTVRNGQLNLNWNGTQEVMTWDR